MGTKLTNNATGRLAVSLTAASTQLSMVVGDAVKFPTIAEGSGDNFPLTAVKTNGELEIMLCTLTNGNVFTVQRGQEGTSPKAFSAGDRIELRLTAGTIDGMIDDRIDAAIEVVLEDLGTAAYKNVGINLGDVVTQSSELRSQPSQRVASTINSANDASSAWNHPLNWNFGIDNSNNALRILVSSEHNQRVATIQSGHNSVSYASDVGILDLNPVGGLVRINRNQAYHSGNFPPVGFVYTQYPGEATPSALFGGTWSLLFNTEGIAFRTEGGNASSFGGGIQQDAYGSHSHSASSNSTGAHTHNTSGTAASAGGHAHTASSNSTGAHTHNISGTAASAGGHTHSTNINHHNEGNSIQYTTRREGIRNTSYVNTSSNGAHTHSVSGTAASAGGHSHTVSVASGGEHTHSVSGTAASAGAHSHTITVSASGSNETRMINRTFRVWKRTA